MNSELKILGIIPARGGSKGIPKKNIIKLNKKPLIEYTITEAKKSKYLSNIVVSTDNAEISKISQKLNVQVIKRPKKLAQDKSSTSSVILHVLQEIKKQSMSTDLIVLLQPTSPMRTANDIDNTISKFLKSSCDSAVTVSLVSHPVEWIYKSIKNNKISPLFPTKVTRRQNSKKYYQLNGAVYVTDLNYFLKHKTMIGKNLVSHIMPEDRSVDIDNLIDLKYAEFLLKQKI